MRRKNSVLRQLVFFESYRTRSRTDVPGRPKAPPPHEPITRRNPDRSPESKPQPVAPHPGSDAHPSPYAAPEPLPIPITQFHGQTSETNGFERMRYEMRNRSFITTHFEVRRVRRIIPLKSATVGLRHRNLCFKGKQNLV